MRGRHAFRDSVHADYILELSDNKWITLMESQRQVEQLPSHGLFRGWPTGAPVSRTSAIERSSRSDVGIRQLAV